MPEKKCPDCNKSQHVRVRECACGYIFPRKTKKSNKELSQHDVDYVFNGWKVVPARTRNAKCGLCSKKMKGGMNSWHSSYTDGEKYWWCEKCWNRYETKESPVKTTDIDDDDESIDVASLNNLIKSLRK
tara:strand:+ start:13522 stop:13908 length:387 start_codon:yes stop_codon:yes gene_type:complete